MIEHTENRMNTTWDDSLKDVRNIMRHEYPAYTVRLSACCRSLRKHAIPSSDRRRIDNYADRYSVNKRKLHAVYSYIPND